MELFEQMKQLIDLLNKALGEYKKRGLEYANAYKNYRIAVAKKLLLLRADDIPVTICSDLARGDEEVAEMKRQEIITESLYKSCQEAINSYKLQIKILQNQIESEYNNGEQI